jgi:FlaA1/EpsC-like NDP-sugar epimerase
MQPVSSRHLDSLLSLPRSAKKSMAIMTDASLCTLTVWLAICFRFESWVSLTGYQWLAVVLSITLAIPLLSIFGFYHTVVRFAGRETMTAALRALGIYTVIYSAILSTYGLPLVPRTIGLIQPILLLIAIGTSRLLAQHIFQINTGMLTEPEASQNALIFGTGRPAQQLALSLSGEKKFQVLGFIDDDAQLVGGQIQGLRVHHTSLLADVCQRYSVRHILLAKSNVSRTQRNEILQTLTPLNVTIRTLPSIDQWLEHPNHQAEQLRELDIQDLLGRDPIPPYPELLSRNIQDRCVLITGAGGSIGGELARQALSLGARKLLIFDSSEFSLYTIEQELLTIKLHRQLPTTIIPILGDCTNLRDLRHCLESHRPTTVFHAAAYKHVPLVEFNIQTGVRNNVLGTYQAALLAMDYGVQHFTLISTDKAVRPTNVMGTTKRIAELSIHLLQKTAFEKGLGLRYSIVRFGNVLGSSGSVVPKFRAQIAAGGPLTLTHPEITRYFMTMQEAAQLVIQAAAMSSESHLPSPDTYLLDMGDPIKIKDLALLMIRLSGRQLKNDTPDNSGIEITYTGLRPGEKLYEELLVSGDSRTTSHAKIFQDLTKISSEQLAALIDKIPNLSTHFAEYQTSSQAMIALQKIVPDYVPDTRIF